MSIPLLLSSTMRFSAPILLAAIGALFCDCAGVTFIILEAQMLLSCFFSVIGGYYLHSWGLGVLRHCFLCSAGMVFHLDYAEDEGNRAGSWLCN